MADPIAVDPIKDASKRHDGRSLSIGVMVGDDIGFEIVPAAVEVMKTAADMAGLQIEWTEIPIGKKAYDELGHTLPPGTIETLQELDGWLLGPLGHMAYPKEPNAPNPHPIFRRHFQMYCGVKPFRSHRAVPSLNANVDLVFLRENTEGFQPDRNMAIGTGEFRPTDDLTISIRVITRKASERIARSAFEIARTRGKKVTSVHKHTVFALSCGMFAEECRKVAQDYPDVRLNEVMVDTFAYKLVLNPDDFDVVVTTNMYGDILTDVAAALVGGLGMAPGIAVSRDHVMAQATHGSAPDIAGKGLANPYAMIQSGRMMLDLLGQRYANGSAMAAANMIDTAIWDALGEDAARTPDIGGTGTTNSMRDAVLERIANDAR